MFQVCYLLTRKVHVSYDYWTFYALIIQDNFLLRGEFDWPGSNGANQQFHLTFMANEEDRRNAIGLVFDLAKVRCFGAHADPEDRGNPHVIRRAGVDHDVDHFVVVSNGVSLQLTILHNGPPGMPTIDVVKKQPYETIIPTIPATSSDPGRLAGPGLFALNRYASEINC
jgi:hypothetical protein